jgi:F-type H+-transporting ATPase subunit b
MVEKLLPLFVGAVPTVLIVFFMFFFLRWAFWRPFERVLAERQARTEGTRKEAESLLAAANQKLHEYEESLRHARAEIFREQAASRQEALEQRNQALRQAREQAGEMIRQAKLDIARDAEEAKKSLDAESQRLADEIARSLLRPAGGRRS